MEASENKSIRKKGHKIVVQIGAIIIVLFALVTMAVGNMVTMASFSTALSTNMTMFENYMDTQEGKKLPVMHCIEGTSGWGIDEGLMDYVDNGDAFIINKVTFGSRTLAEFLAAENEFNPIEKVTLVGLCTDICVISNALTVKAFLPEVPIIVDSSLCAGVTPASHENALEAMKMCQIDVI